MKKFLTFSLIALGLALSSGNLTAFQAKSTAKSTTAASSAPSDADIADAKKKGLVWVNTSTKVYHKDGEFYGKTKQGKFMPEPDAKKAGFREAKTSGKSSKSTTKSTGK